MAVKNLNLREDITGKVVRILSDKELVVNLGYSDGVKLNDEIIIYEIGEEVKTLDGDIIGTLDHIKAKLVVTTVYENLSKCEYPKENITAFEKSALSISKSFVSYETQKSLNVDKNEIEPYKKKHSDKIHIGDNVKIILTKI
ncbi:MAG: hypothetical protein ACTTI7_05370 [Gemella haemolysans]|uniref:hypothetical protein n=1 Tax=Gemella haemolysans TaxID=1379 RepID=UPI003FA0AF85